jgi:hypothetical protein
MNVLKIYLLDNHVTIVFRQVIDTSFWTPLVLEFKKRAFEPKYYQLQIFQLTVLFQMATYDMLVLEEKFVKVIL